MNISIGRDYSLIDGKPSLADRFISNHGFGRFLFWEIGLRDWLSKPGRLQIRFENCREAELQLRPIMQFDAAIHWE